MMASVSSAAADNRWGRAASWARSIASVYSARVRICQPPAISTSSTPCPSLSLCNRSSSSAELNAALDASGSSGESSSTGTGRALANSAASSSFARVVTGDLNVGKWPRLRHTKLAEPLELEQPEQRRQHLTRRRVLAHHVRPLQPRLDREQRPDDLDRGRHVER